MTTKADKRLEREQRMYDALKEIATGYRTLNKLRARSGKDYGLSYEEALEYSYENIQTTARYAIRGMRRPA